MATFNTGEAKTQLSWLLRRAAAGEEIVIARDGVWVARLVGLTRTGRREVGRDRGAFTVPDSFDDPLDFGSLEASGG